MEDEKIVQDEQNQDIENNEDINTEETKDNSMNQEDDQQEEKQQEETEDSSKTDEKKGLFSKKKDKKDEKIEELTDKVKRQLAEFENYRNRTEKEKSHMYAVGASDVIGKILPVVDNFERGLAAIPQEEKTGPLAEGMEKIYKQFVTVLTEIGVEPIETVGKEFDPNLHNAVMHEENEDAGENIIVEEFQKGYTYKDTVIRHSMVKVAN